MGLYVAIEGIDTAGKSTQISALRQHYLGCEDGAGGFNPLFTQSNIRQNEAGNETGGLNPLFTQSVGSEDSAKNVSFITEPLPFYKDFLLGHELSSRALFLLFLSSRAQIFASFPHSSLIISDRSLISGIAYAEDTSYDEALAMSLYATAGRVPDLGILLELDRDKLQRRLALKRLDKIEMRGIDYLLGVQARIKEAATLLGVRLVCIDAGLSRGAITARILEEIGTIKG